MKSTKDFFSRVRRGLIIPPLFMRVRIADFFKVDSAVIWKFWRKSEDD